MIFGFFLLPEFIFLQIANDIRHVIRDYTKAIPTILEIPSKDQPYDPEQDSVMQRVLQFVGGPAS